MALKTSIPSSLGNLRLSKISRGGAAPLRLRNPPRPKRKSSASSPSRATAISASLSSSLKGRTVSSTSSGLSSTTRMSIRCGSAEGGRWGRDSSGAGFLPELLIGIGWIPTSSLPCIPAAQRQVKCRSALRLGLGPNPASVFMRNALHQGQSRSVALELIRSMQPLKHAEQLPGVAHLEPNSIVRDGHANLTIELDRPNSDHSLLAGPGELDRVGEQVVQRQLDQAAVALHAW